MSDEPTAPIPQWSPPPAGPYPAAPQPVWGAPPLPPPPSASSGGSGGPGLGCVAAAAVGLLAVAVLFLGAVVVTRDDGPSAGEATTTAAEAPATSGPEPEMVPAEGGRVLPAPEEPPFDDRFSFIATRSDGTPVTWSPCESIRYVVDPRTEPPEGRAAIDDSVAMIEELTGLDFVFEGEVDEPAPGPAGRTRRDPERYGDGWSPVLFSWSDPSEEPDLSDALGFTYSQDVEATTGERVWVTGHITLDGSAMGELTRDRLTRTIVHEIGHLVGLGHVMDASQLMYDTATDTLVVGDGDRTGFYLEGTGPCVESSFG